MSGRKKRLLELTQNCVPCIGPQRRVRDFGTRDFNEMLGGVPKNGYGAQPRKSSDEGELPRFFLAGAQIVSEVCEGTASSERALSCGLACWIAQGQENSRGS